MRSHTDLHYASLAEVARRLADGDLSSVELTQHLLDRIRALDPRLSAYVAVRPDEALAEARQADDEMTRGLRRGPLHGVPVALKDLVDMAGAITTAGTRVRARHVAARDATVTTRLRQAGAVILGKVKLTEGAFAEHHPDVVPPVNPWSAEHWTGVSSSGSGVAVAAGLCFGALGTDTGGSIRFPSTACGVTGLKPTWGRVSRAGVFALADSLDHVGPMTRTARDAALMLGVLAGADPDDPTALADPVPDYAAALDGNVRGLRIGIDPGYAMEPTEPAVRGAVGQLLATFRALGADVRTIRLPDASALIDGWAAACAVETAIAHQGLYPERASEYGPQLRALIDVGRTLPSLAYGRLMHARLAYSGALATVFRDVDVVVAPALAMTTPTNTRLAEILDGGTAPALAYTAPFNMSGSPSLTVPAGASAEGLPIGVQLIGRHLDEALLLKAGDAFQRATDWHTRHPAL